MTTDTKAIEVYKAKINEVISKATSLLTITSPEENATVIESKAALKRLGKEVKTEKEKATKPINEALKKVREWWAPLELSISKEEDRVDGMLLTYKHKVEAENRLKEEKIAARVERGTLKLETAERKLESLEQVQKTNHTQIGDVQFRQVPKMRVVDENLIPDKYWVIDLVSLRRDVVAGMVVPGAEKYYEEIV